MAISFVPATLNLLDAFASNRSYRIPVYQRAYAWPVVQVRRLLEDILSAIEDAGEGAEVRSYFLGVIVLLGPGDARVDSPDASLRQFDIIDGQQRLVSLTILLAVLRDICARDGDTETAGHIAPLVMHRDADGAERLRLNMRLGEASAFQAVVQQPGATLNQPDEGRAEGSARGSIEKIVENREDLRSVVEGLSAGERQRLCEFLLGDCVMVSIETNDIENAYQIYLTLNDRGLLLSRSGILKAYCLGGLPAADEDRLHRQWNDWETAIGENRLDDFFSYLHKIEGRPGTAILRELLVLLKQSGAQTFLEQTIAPLIGAFQRIERLVHLPREEPAPVDKLLLYLSWCRHNEWVPSALVAMTRFGRHEERLVAFLTRLDRLTYAMMIVGLGRSERIRRYRNILLALRRDDDQALDAALAVTNQEQRNLYYNLSNDMHATNKQDCRLVLCRISDYIAGTTTLDPPANLTVEHVLPRNPRKDSVWRQWYRDDAERTRRERGLGNLVLVTKAQNDAARNKDFAEKKAIFFPDDAAHSVALTDRLRDHDTWRPEDVDRNNAYLLGLVRDIWALERTPPQDR